MFNEEFGIEKNNGLVFTKKPIHYQTQTQRTNKSYKPTTC